MADELQTNAEPLELKGPLVDKIIGAVSQGVTPNDPRYHELLGTSFRQHGMIPTRELGPFGVFRDLFSGSARDQIDTQRKAEAIGWKAVEHMVNLRGTAQQELSMAPPSMGMAQAQNPLAFEWAGGFQPSLLQLPQPPALPGQAPGPAPLDFISPPAQAALMQQPMPPSQAHAYMQAMPHALTTAGAMMTHEMSMKQAELAGRDEISKAYHALDLLPSDSPRRQAYLDKIVRLTEETAVRGQELSAQVTREGHAITQRGQDLTDARQREMNGIVAAGNAPPEWMAAQAQMMAAGDQPFPTGRAATSPMGARLIAMAKQLNPDVKATTFHTRQKAQIDFVTGPEGNKVRSANVAILHLGTLDNLIDALGTGNVPLINKFANIYATQTGLTAPGNFDAAKLFVSEEISKFLIGAASTKEERLDAAAAISNAKSPAQLRGVIKTYMKLFGGQIEGLRKQYEVGTGQKDFNKFLFPETLAATGQGTAPGKVIDFKDLPR